MIFERRPELSLSCNSMLISGGRSFQTCVLVQRPQVKISMLDMFQNQEESQCGWRDECGAEKGQEIRKPT